MKILKYFLAGSLLLLIALGTLSSLQAATVMNNSDSGAGSLRQAIIDAADGETISIPTSIGTITLTSGEIEILKDITIQGAGAGVTILDGNANDRIFRVGSFLPGQPATVTITGVTIKNGKNTRAINQGGGGAIAVGYDSTLRLENSHIGPNNTTTQEGGGGIYSTGSVIVVNSTIDGNSAAGAGGGIECLSGTVDLTDTTISNNNSSYGGGLINNICKVTLRGTSIGAEGCNITGNTSSNEGGGIYSHNSDAENIIDTCTISGNTAGEGGGIAISSSPTSTTILNSIITGNHAIGGPGGGINDAYCNGLSESLMVIDRTTISNNDATGAGGGYFKCSSNELQHSTTITNTTISGNRARSGGGIAVGFGGEISGLIDMSNSTLFKNEAESGGGIRVDSPLGLNLNSVTIAGNIGTGISGEVGGISGPKPVISIQNTLIADNSKDCDTTEGLIINSQGHNLIGVVDTNCALGGDLTGNIINQPSGLDPSGLQANGSTGPMTVALLASSRALGGADLATVTAADERGVTRPQGPGPDIGAFESNLTFSPAPGGGSVSSGGCSLTALSNISGSGWLNLLPLMVVGFALLRLRTHR